MASNNEENNIESEESYLKELIETYKIQRNLTRNCINLYIFLKIKKYEKITIKKNVLEKLINYVPCKDLFTLKNETYYSENFIQRFKDNILNMNLIYLKIKEELSKILLLKYNKKLTEDGSKTLELMFLEHIINIELSKNEIFPLFNDIKTILLGVSDLRLFNFILKTMKSVEFTEFLDTFDFNETRFSRTEFYDFRKQFLLKSYDSTKNEKFLFYKKLIYLFLKNNINEGDIRKTFKFFLDFFKVKRRFESVFKEN
ncbi:hypothetical protein A0H76_1556 [Hepatospora eriocheir]|uniref:Uncharacterized protein n=1 Tax=Hepatospora eriocheir TaxID=1081669 RepID=A0A1X0QGX1_9MICR|nr:hypothetical protein A0H76_1556 [Hepatospora eriocheir]